MEKQELHICYLELIAKFLTIIEVYLLARRFPSFIKKISSKIVIVKSDSTNVVAWFTKGRCPTYPFNRVLEAIFHLEITMGVRFRAEWVPSAKQKADCLTRGSKHFSFKSIRRRKKSKNTKHQTDDRISRRLKVQRHSKEAIRIMAKAVALGQYNFDMIDFDKRDFTVIVRTLPPTLQHTFKQH